MIKYIKSNQGFGLFGIVAMVAVLIVLVGGWYFAYQRFAKPTDTGGTACIQDAKLCPDGSSVSRTGPNCEFQECPQGSDIIFGQEAENLCGPQPPAICQPGKRLGCDRRTKHWDCYPILGEEVDISDWKTYPSTSSGQAATDTSDWKLYRNEKFGFEVKYPPNWELEIGVYGADYSAVKLSDYESDSFIVFVPNGQSPYGFPSRYESSSTEIIGGVNVIKKKASEGRRARQADYYFNTSNSKYAAFIIQTFQSSISGGNQKDIDAILRTFRFIELIDTSSWKTYPSTSSGQATIDTSDWTVYRNEKYGFEVRYPPDWRIASYSSEERIALNGPKRQAEFEQPDAVEIPNELFITVSPINQSIFPFEEFVGDQRDGWFRSYENKSEEIISGRRALRYSTTSFTAPAEAVFVDGKSFVLGFTLADYPSQESAARSAILNSILTTLKFVE